MTGYESTALASPSSRRRPGTRLVWPALASVAALAVIWGLIGLFKPPSDQAVLGITDAPGTGTVEQTAPPTDSINASEPPVATDPGSSVPGGATGPTPTPGTGRAPTPPPGPGKTPHPAPTPGPTPTSPAPTPTPGPTPTAAPTQCIVPNFVGLDTRDARPLWHGAGFTGSISFSPAVPPPYIIRSQSLAAGASVACSSGITVFDTP